MTIRDARDGYLRSTGREAEADRLHDVDGISGLVASGGLAYAPHLMGSPAEPANTEPWVHLNMSLGSSGPGR